MPPPTNSDHQGIVVTILGSLYIPIVPLLLAGGLIQSMNTNNPLSHSKRTWDFGV